MADSLPRSFGRYELLERLGAGGMAEVFLARMHTAGSITKSVVLKKILKAYADDPGFIDMFRDEAKVALRLTHANVVQVFDFGEQAGEWFLVMEYVRGKNLRELLRALAAKGADALPAPLALHIAAEAARGLHHAHTRKDDAGQSLGIVHRDVSPHNILVSFEGDVKIADFGIAKAHDRSSAKTQVGVLKGKLPYLAPELLFGHQADPRSDVWALGATLWEMLVGYKLNASPSDSAIVESLRSAQPFPLASSVASNIAPEVDRVVARALEKDPGKRTESALIFSRELSALLSGDGAAELEAAMGFAFEGASAPRWVPVPEPTRTAGTETAPRVGPIPAAPSRAPTTGSKRPREVLEVEMPFDPDGHSNALLAHFIDARAFLGEAYQPHDGKRCMFIDTDSAVEVVAGETIVVVVTFERPVARFRLSALVLSKRVRATTTPRGRAPAGVLVELQHGDADTRLLYEYLGFPE